MQPGKAPKLSGTFLCADYCNTWTDERFDREMQILKEVDMEYLILMSNMLRQGNGNFNVSYPTKIQEAAPFYKGTDVIEKILQYAEKYGIKVFIGLNLDDDWWKLWWELDKLEEGKEWLFDQMRIGNQMADEIYERYYAKHPRSFYGWYWMWECWNFPIMSLTDRGRHQAIKTLADALNISLDHLNSIDCTLPCLISPFVNTDLTTVEDQFHQWSDLFALSHLRYGDIFCPQDSCGAGGQKVKDLDAWFGAYRRAVDTKPGLRMWGNNENFESPDWSSTTVDNYVKQLEITDKYVDVHVSFAYIHYYSPTALEYDGYHKAFLFYKENGFVSYELPENVQDVTVDYNEAEKTAVITWNHPCAEQVAGCRVFRNGMYIGRVKRGRYNEKEELDEMVFTFTDSDAAPNAEGKLVYAVAAYNPSGNFSRKGTFTIK